MVILRTAWTTSCTRWAATARRPRPPRTTRTPIGASARSWGGCTRSEVVDEALAWPSCNCLVQKSTNQRKQEPKEDFDSKQSSSFIPKQCKADFYILMINVIWMIGLLLIILILPVLVSTQLQTQSIKIKRLQCSMRVFKHSGSILAGPWWWWYSGQRLCLLLW